MSAPDRVTREREALRTALEVLVRCIEAGTLVLPGSAYHDMARAALSTPQAGGEQLEYNYDPERGTFSLRLAPPIPPAPDDHLSAVHAHGYASGYEAAKRECAPAPVAGRRETADTKRYVVGFLFSEDERCVVLLRKTHPAWQAGKLNGFGGHVEPGETFDAAMVREGLEEAGVQPRGGWEKFAVLCGEAHPKGSAEPWEMHCYRAPTGSDRTGLSGTVNACNDVGEVFEIHEVADVVAGKVETIPNLAWLVPMAQEARRHDWPYRIVVRASRQLRAPAPGTGSEEAPYDADAPGLSLDNVPCGPLGYTPIDAVAGMAARMREFHARERHGSVMILTIGRDRCESYWQALEQAARMLRAARTQEESESDEEGRHG